MNSRIWRVPAVALLVALAAASTACGTERTRPEAAPSTGAAPLSAAPTATVPGAPTVPPASTAPGASAAGTPSDGPSATAPAPGPTAGRTDTPSARRNSPPPVVLPKRPAGAPSARTVVDAFRAAKLPVPNPRDRSVDCGPDGQGLGCSELIATDAVTVYVFPDETAASDIADTWSGMSYRHGTVVLNYLEARTPSADRPRYERVLAGLG
ncbi:hypothetical protein ACN28G_04715 [Micromonospora sp. WMMA1923]|uniref:hypothetical protein n=1 Tax=Micromonospora sp. WMMA1923 TaxID=3404125 RepID=UPI003B95B59E